jgi:dUTP pyrophosphatase
MPLSRRRPSRDVISQNQQNLDTNNSKKIVKYKCEETGLEIEKANENDSGYDLKSKIETIIEKGKYKTIPTGIFLELPSNTDAEIRPRSGLAKNSGITVLNSPGTIDNGYRGEIKVILINHGEKEWKVKKFDRIAQILFNERRNIQMEKVENIQQTTQRESQGFGSSDTNIPK